LNNSRHYTLTEECTVFQIPRPECTLNANVNQNYILIIQVERFGLNIGNIDVDVYCGLNFVIYCSVDQIVVVHDIYGDNVMSSEFDEQKL
jgi:hypothetical protein